MSRSRAKWGGSSCLDSKDMLKIRGRRARFAAPADRFVAGAALLSFLKNLKEGAVARRR